MNIRYLTLLTTLTLLGLSISAFAAKPICPGDPRCKDDNSGTITYTVELELGAFRFNTFPGLESIVNVTPLSKGNELRSDEDLDMIRPIDGGVLEATWNDVFNTCTELLALNSVGSFFVANDNWTIERAGGVRVIFRDILLADAEVRVQLIGNEFDFDDNNPFLPAPGSAKEYELTQFAISGSTVKGVHPRSGCQPSGGGGFDIFDLIPHSTLVITATEQ